MSSPIGGFHLALRSVDAHYLGIEEHLDRTAIVGRLWPQGQSLRPHLTGEVRLRQGWPLIGQMPLRSDDSNRPGKPFLAKRRRTFPGSVTCTDDEDLVRFAHDPITTDTALAAPAY